MVDLVRRELTEGWMRDLVRDRRSLADKARDYARRTYGLSEAVEPPPLPTAAELRAHIAKVTEKFTARFRFVPTTVQPAEYFMALALSRGGAFVEGGKGFNDTVILASIIEDMTGRGLDAAVFISEDRGFQSEGVKQVTGDKHLHIVTSIEELGDILDQLISDRVHADLKERKETLLTAVKAHQGQLTEFLRQSLPTITDDLALVDKVRNIQLLDILAYENVHSVPFVLGQENREENRLSVDVRGTLNTSGLDF